MEIRLSLFYQAVLCVIAKDKIVVKLDSMQRTNTQEIITNNNYRCIGVAAFNCRMIYAGTRCVHSESWRSRRDFLSPDYFVVLYCERDPATISPRYIEYRIGD